MRLIALLVLVATLVACGEPRLDGSSEEALKASIEAVKKPLSREDRKRFEDAVLKVGMQDVNIFAAAVDKDALQRRLRDNLDGKTAHQVIEEGERLAAKRSGTRSADDEEGGSPSRAAVPTKQSAEDLRTAIREMETRLAALREQREARERAAEEIKAFVVERSAFRFEKNDFMTQPEIELVLRNGTSRAVSRAYFHGVLTTPGREIPWVEDDFNHTIRGGLEPGERRTFSLSPNMFGEWSSAPKDRDDMILKVAVTRLDGADGKPYLETKAPDSDSEREAKLEERLERCRADLARIELGR